jgi:formate/nitrite transporter FocA (FNT family)
LHANLPSASWQPLLSKFGYSVGFLIVILGRQQLFTENTLTPVLQLLQEKSRGTLVNTTRLWGVVLGANLVGTLIFALVLATTSVIRPETLSAFDFIATHALDGGFSNTLVRAIFAGWLIALMVWLLPVAETSRVTVIIIITYLVGIAGFPHIIAGSSEVFYALFTGTASPATALTDFFLPTLLGNTIGGVAMVAAINYAQVYASGD